MIASLHIQIAFDPDQGGRYMQLARAIRTCLHAYGIHSSTIQPEYTKPGFGDVAADSLSPDGSGGPITGYGTAGESSRATSDNGGGSTGEPACLLECGDGCETVKCCGPVSPDVGDAGHGGHGHSH